MTINLHEQVLSLLLEKDPAQIDSESRFAAEDHLRNCFACAARIGAREFAMAEMRSVACQVSATRELVRNTQLQVRLYAAERLQQRDRMSPVWMSAGLAGIWAIGSIPVLWSGFEWIGQATQLPSFAWQTAAVFSWIAPTGLLAAIAVARRERVFTD